MRTTLVLLFAYVFYMVFFQDKVYEWYLNKPPTGSSTFVEDTARGYCDNLGDLTGSTRQAVARQLIKLAMETQGDVILRSKEICPNYWK
tara:strand:+ start:62 stop:328 length:267 start_codon:yes stop_codon:yes gene_type:complete